MSVAFRSLLLDAFQAVWACLGQAGHNHGVLEILKRLLLLLLEALEAPN